MGSSPRKVLYCCHCGGKLDSYAKCTKCNPILVIKRTAPPPPPPALAARCAIALPRPSALASAAQGFKHTKKVHFHPTALVATDKRASMYLPPRVPMRRSEPIVVATWCEKHEEWVASRDYYAHAKQRTHTWCFVGGCTSRMVCKSAWTDAEVFSHFISQHL